MITTNYYVRNPDELLKIFRLIHLLHGVTQSVYVVIYILDYNDNYNFIKIPIKIQ